MNKKTIRRELDRLARMVEAAWKRHEGRPDHGNHPFVCAKVGSVGCCTNTAVYLASRLNGKVYGYSIEDNPEAEVGSTEGGHDFAIVDDRWLLDFWAKDYYHLPDLYDMENPAEMVLVHKRYGDPKLWQQMSVENMADNKESQKHITE